MKKIVLLILLFNASYSLNAQTGITWSSPVDIAIPLFGNEHPRIALDRNNNPLVLWGKGIGNQAFFSRWNGTMFNAPLMVNPVNMPIFAASWAGPDLASHGDTVYVIFKREPEDTSHIYIIHSYDGGISFTQPAPVDNITNSTRFPNLGTDTSGQPLVAFMKFDNGFNDPQYVLTRSTDYGNTFLPEVQASGFSGGLVCDCCPAAAVASASHTAVVYRDNNNNFRNMWAGVSTDGGLTFPNGMPVDQTNWFNNSCPSSGPDAVIIGDSLYTVFMSEGTGDALVYFSSASLTTLQPGTETAITGMYPGLASQNYPRIAHHGNTAAIAWRQTITTGQRIIMMFTNNLSNGLPAVADTIAAGGQLVNVDVALADGAVHLVWEDATSGTVKYRKGSFTPTAVSETLSFAELSVHPNPAKDRAVIKWNTKNFHAQKLVLGDLTGRILFQKNILNQHQSEVNLNYLSGLYILKLYDGLGTEHVAKVMIQ